MADTCKESARKEDIMIYVTQIDNAITIKQWRMTRNKAGEAQSEMSLSN